MFFKKSIGIFFFFLTFLLTSTAQELSIKDIKGLNPSHQINHIYRLMTHNNNGLLLADTRFENGDLDGLLIYFDDNGKVLKEIRTGRINSFERIVDLISHENGYHLLLNSTSQRGETSLLFYGLDNDLSIISTKEISIAKMNTADAFTFNPKTNELKIVVSVTDESNKTFPRLVSYHIENETQSYFDLDQKNRPEKLEDFVYYKMVTNAEGQRVSQKISVGEMKAMGMGNKHKEINKECISIRFADENYNELLLTGLENSSAFTDFWAAKVVDNKVIWEDRFPTEVGGDEGKVTFKTNNGYIIFGHEYTKTDKRFYSYRLVVLDKEGKQISEKQFDTGKKDWFKDVEQLGEEYFLMLGQTQLVTRKGLRKEDETHTSNLWTILVNDKGEKITDYVHETESLDEAYALTKLKSGDSLIVYKSDDILKIAKIYIHIP